MKKAKIISILIIMLSVVALGVFMGKQMFKLIEAGSTPANKAGVATSSVQILYSAATASSPAYVPAPEISPAASPLSVETEKSEAGQVSSTSSSGLSTPGTPEFTPEGPKWFAYASGNGINVRNGPTTASKRLFKVAKGTRGSVVEKKNGWTKIKWDFNKQFGWVRDDLLVQGPSEVISTLVQKTGDVEKINAKQINKASAKKILKENKVVVAIAKSAPVAGTVRSYTEGEKLPEQAKISADPFANIRSDNNVGAAKVGKLPKGVVVKIKQVKRAGKWLWFEIEFNNGKKTGWTREDNLSF